MPSPKDDLRERLARYRQIELSVIGRKSGQTISVPVWFVLEGDTVPGTRSRLRHTVVSECPQELVDSD